MEQLELEGITSALVRAGGQDTDEPPRLRSLTFSLLGEGSIELVPGLRTEGESACVRGRWRIFLRRSLPAWRRPFVLAHELVEWWLHVREHYDGHDVEHCANFGAAAVIVPRRAFRRAVTVYGRELPALAEAFGTSQTLMALREEEIDRIPRAVITPDLVRVRGPEEWAWPDERTLRTWGRRPIPGLRKTVLTDAPRRVAIDAEETG